MPANKFEPSPARIQHLETLVAKTTVLRAEMQLTRQNILKLLQDMPVLSQSAG